MRLALHSYWRSSSAWRVRIGLHWKELPFEYCPVDLRAGEQFADPHSTRNPMRQVPVLEVEEDGRVRHLAQSMAILEWLEERFPERPLLPRDGYARARVRMLAEHVNSGIQPFQNSAPQQWLKARQAGLERDWVHKWVGDGMAALERAVADGAGRFCHGDAPTVADAYLVPQLYGARRFGIDVEAFPTLLRVERACAELPAFARAAPDAQPDAPPPEQRR
ncbi:MAG TPA: maleylacetoacetate isomerase [Anaeromyxobacteraceae bacterium]|nr:maleylacetoacetate isomerase [Anaeromyxobacteraceae bacterium]